MKAELTYRAKQRRKRLNRRRKIFITTVLAAFLIFTALIIFAIAAPEEAEAAEAEADETEADEAEAAEAEAAGQEPEDETTERAVSAEHEPLPELADVTDAEEESKPEDEAPEVEAEQTGETEESPLLSVHESYMLAKMAMAEAEGEDTEGKALVILVILNRVESESFPDTIGEVISQTNAFTSYGNGRYDAVEPDEDCWTALELIEAEHWDGSCGALYFERTPASGVSTWHSENLEKLFTHGAHTFYREATG